MKTLTQLMIMGFIVGVAPLLVAAGEEGGILRFYVHYATVQHSLKNDRGEFDKLMALANLDVGREASRADFLADFWHQRAANSCETVIDRAIKQSAKSLPPKPSQKQEDAAMEQVWKSVEPCLFSYYYDHWEAINQTIRDRYETAMREKPPAMGKNRQQGTR